MSVRVYQFGCDPPSPETAHLVRAQLRAAHDYRNELVAIERGRRDAMRALHDSDEVRAAEVLLRQASKTDRKACKLALFKVRREVLERKKDEARRINDLAHDLQLGARALTRCYWGTYLEIEAGQQAARKAPLYADDGLEPASPRFVRWRDPMPGQIGVQLQAHGDDAWTTADVLSGRCSYVRLSDGGHPKWRRLSIRVGSEGRAPVWAHLQLRLHRAIPDAARWKWVRVSVRPEGLREKWTCEITIDDPAPRARDLDRDLSGAVAVAFGWDALSDGSIRAATWQDMRGERGEVILPAHLVQAIRKGDGIRAVRDVIWNDAMPKIARAIKTAREPLPRWLSDAANTLHLWRSLNRVHELRRRWLLEGFDGAREAFDLLDRWAISSGRSGHGDRHLYDYEASGRGQALRRRRELYRTLAASWARTYRHALLSDQDVSREARFGPDSDVRFTAAVHELRMALRNAFGDDAIDTAWDREEAWCERACAAYGAGGSRGPMFAERKEKVTNAWAGRKRRKAESATAREGAPKPSESHADGG